MLDLRLSTLLATFACKANYSMQQELVSLACNLPQEHPWCFLYAVRVLDVLL